MNRIKTTMAILALALCQAAKAGDTYDCINAKGDYINYGPALIHNDYIVVAEDGARYEERWHAMLDPDDWKALIFLGAGRTRTDNVIIHQSEGSGPRR